MAATRSSQRLKQLSVEKDKFALTPLSKNNDISIPPDNKNKPTANVKPFRSLFSKVNYPKVSLSLPSSNIELKHIFGGFFLRVLLIIIGEIIDKSSKIQYTDVDYIVFTDASRYVSNYLSPYLRNTYRYSPIISYLCLPNIFVHQVFGKLLFCIIDIFISYIIYEISLLYSTPKLAKISALLWLYNPLSIIISTRGNSDSIICFLVLTTLYYRLKNKVLLTGFFLAFSIHLRMYPLLFSLPIFLSLKSIKDKLRLVFSCILTLGVLSGVFYYLYDYKFISESYLYHLSREDIKHNYSVHFLLQYLGISTPVLKFVPLLILQVLCAIKFFKLNDLPLCMFLQCFIFVTFSPVLTCQYFIWFVSLFIPILPQFINIKSILIRFVLWIIIQLLWLVPAYYLEYQGLNVFFYVGGMCVLFFFINVNIISKLIEFYTPMKKIQ